MSPVLVITLQLLPLQPEAEEEAPVRIQETSQIAYPNTGKSDGWMGLGRLWTWGNLTFKTGLIHQRVTGCFWTRYFLFMDHTFKCQRN